MVLTDHESDYAALLNRNNTTTMELKRFCTLVIEIFKTINNINPSFMKDSFTSKRDPKIKPYDILVRHHEPAKYSDKI